MKNSDLWKQHEDYTKDLSSNCRNLGFAAAAIAWFFKTAACTFPPTVVKVLAFVVAFFIADVLQYLTAAVFLSRWTRKQEKNRYAETGSIEGDYDKPAWLDYPARALWWVKIACLILAYIFIGIHLSRV